MSTLHLFTSESVSEGHPDKIADQISDAILDAFLARDPHARVACETLVADGHVTLAGEFKTAPEVYAEVRDQAPDIVRGVLRDIGYRDADTGIDPERCDISVRFNRQSPDINRGVDRSDGVIGAGDQGLVFGYATEETPSLMPYPIWLSHQLVRRQAALRKSGALPWLLPDAKSQVSIVYRGRDVVGVDTVVLSTQHTPDVSNETIRDAVVAEIVEPLIPPGKRLPGFRVLVNPTGRFETGGPKGDTGLTGRKIIVDSYGGSCPHGGGAFSGKDPTKVDRSAAYLARNIAKTIVAPFLARRCTVQLAYAIGVAEPVSVMVDTHGTSLFSEAVGDNVFEDAIRRHYDLTPAGIIRQFDLCRPIYRQTAAYGHFGRNELPWEDVTKGPLLSDSVFASARSLTEHRRHLEYLRETEAERAELARKAAEKAERDRKERLELFAPHNREMLTRFTRALADGKSWSEMDAEVALWWWNRY